MRAVERAITRFFLAGRAGEPVDVRIELSNVVIERWGYQAGRGDERIVLRLADGSVIDLPLESVIRVRD